MIPLIDSEKNKVEFDRNGEFKYCTYITIDEGNIELDVDIPRRINKNNYFMDHIYLSCNLIDLLNSALEHHYNIPDTQEEHMKIKKFCNFLRRYADKFEGRFG